MVSLCLCVDCSHYISFCHRRSVNRCLEITARVILVKVKPAEEGEELCTVQHCFKEKLFEFDK